jgi:hypothetical protein
MSEVSHLRLQFWGEAVRSSAKPNHEASHRQQTSCLGVHDET